jgi:hypothetical protein
MGAACYYMYFPFQSIIHPSTGPDGVWYRLRRLKSYTALEVASLLIIIVFADQSKSQELITISSLGTSISQFSPFSFCSRFSFQERIKLCAVILLISLMEK